MSHPEIMRNIHEDFCATVSGQFSPDDWQHIVERAELQWRENLRTLPGGELEAWQGVVRDFHQQRYWGFRPNYRAPVVRKKANLGISMIWMTLNSMLTFKLAVLWFGQIYSRSDDPKDKWLFFAILLLSCTGYIRFLWRNRAYQD